MEWLVDNWYVVVGLVAVIVVASFVVIKFFNLPTKEQLTKIKEWLVYACMEAEKELGGKTGQLKLRMVYDKFLEKFEWLAKVITFEQLSKMVDESLEKLKHLLETNQAVKNIVEGK